MSREILFRGKSIKDGRWYYGGYTWFEGYPAENLPEMYWINYSASGNMVRIEVDPETIGQWTGKTDKNGEKIFEGMEVLHTFFNKYYKIVFQNARYKGLEIQKDWVMNTYGMYEIDMDVCDQLEIVKETDDK